MEERMNGCEILGGQVVGTAGIEVQENIWIYKDQDPQIYIRFKEPVRGFRFSCEVGEADTSRQRMTVYYRKEGEAFSESNTCRMEVSKHGKITREIRFGFSVCEVRIDPAETPGKCEMKSFVVCPLREEDTIENTLGERIKGRDGQKKIVVLTRDLSKTGAPILAYNIAEGLKRKGWDVVVLAGREGNGFLERKYEAAEIPVITLEGSEGEGFGYISLNEKELSESEAKKHSFSKKVARVLAKHGYRTVIANTIVAGAYVELLKDYGMKIISLIHEMKTSIAFYGFVPDGKHVEKYADYIVFPNSFVKEDFRKLFPKTKGTCLVRPQGVYLKRGKKTAEGSLKQLGLREDARIIMSSGSCELRKGVDLFISAATMFLNRHKEEEIHFVWTGDFHNEELKCWMLDQVARSGHTDRIHFIPFIQEEGLYRTVLEHAEAFWGMSREDPFPSTILEAMDNRIPVVGFYGTGGIQVMLEEGRGILIENLDLERFVSQTERLLLDKELRDEILPKAKAYVENLDFDSYVDFLAELSEQEMRIKPFLDLYQWEKEQQFYQCQLQEKEPEERQKELAQAVSADRFRRRKTDEREIVLLDTAIGSDNVGDEILMDYCGKVCAEVFPGRAFWHIPTHIYDPAAETIENYVKILCGPHLLSTQMEESRQWALPKNIKNYKHICLLGAGMQQLEIERPMSTYTKKLLRYMLHTKYLHSVRDEETKRRLEEIGIRNVLNTGCPTMWRLTKEHCAGIPAGKAEQVVTTVTDYMKCTEKDRYMLELLKKCYRRVHIWIQGQKDYEYLREMIDLEGVQIIPPSLEKLDEVLSKEETDYVGTRLHAGIRSLNFQKRSLVIGVDNRARAIAADTGLPILERAEMEEKLEDWIRGEKKTEIRIPIREIETWKNQF